MQFEKSRETFEDSLARVRAEKAERDVKIMQVTSNSHIPNQPT